MSNHQYNLTGNHGFKASRLWQTLTICSMIALGAAGPVAADIIDGDLDGFYVPQHGWAVTQEVSRPELGETPTQIGSYSMVLVREGWGDLPQAEKKRVRKLLGIRGSLRGVMDMETFTVSHTLATERRNGVLYTQGDFLQPEAGDPYCTEGVPLVGVETLNFAMGTGAYSALGGGTIQVHGTVNNCSDHPEYRQNNFTVIPGVGGIRFDSDDEVRSSEPNDAHPGSDSIDWTSMAM